MTGRLILDGIDIEVVKKDIKHLHVGVYPPDGRVRVAAPLRMDDEPIRLAVASRLSWIKRQRRQFLNQERQGRREYVSRESHYFLGHRYLLDVVYRDGPSAVRVRNTSVIELAVPVGAERDYREHRFTKWYRSELKTLVEPMIGRWAPKLGIAEPEWAVKRMRTRWGTCNADIPRVWLNLELIKKPTQCIEYVVVHELAHIIEKNHTDRFRAVMDEAMPQWRAHREILNAAPLAYENWKY